MVANNYSLLQSILSELQQLRRDVNQRNTPATINTQTPTGNHGHPYPRIKAARQLLHNITNQPPKIGHCWYHIRHGIATNPRNCPGPKSCSWNQVDEVTKMKLQQSSTPTQKRLIKVATPKLHLNLKKTFLWHPSHRS